MTIKQVAHEAAILSLAADGPVRFAGIIDCNAVLALLHDELVIVQWDGMPATRGSGGSGTVFITDKGRVAATVGSVG